MLLNWLEDDVSSEREKHGSFADTVAIAACLVAALIVHHHAFDRHATLYSAARAPHALAIHHPMHSRRV